MRPLFPHGSRLRCLCLIASVLPLFAGCISPAQRPPAPDPAAVAQERLLQDQLAVAASLADLQKLQRVAFPLLRAAAELPGVRSRPSLGIFVDHARLLRREHDAALKLGLTDTWTVREVFPGSPATELQPGDRILAADGAPLPPPTSRRNSRSPLVERMAVGRPVRLTIQRDGQTLEITATPVALANYSLRLRSSMEINAKATGNAIQVNRGCLHTLTETELAFVIAHEIAHNAGRHQRAIWLNYLAGTAIDVAALSAGIITANAAGTAAALVHSQGFEYEADAIGVRLMHKTGLPIADVPAIWRRMVTLYPGLRRRSWLPTHPPAPARAVSLQTLVEELLAGQDQPPGKTDTASGS